MDALASDALEEIFLRLDAKSLANCALVCRRWAAILAPSSSFWIRKCKIDKKLIPAPLLRMRANEYASRIDYRVIWRKDPYGRNLIKNDSGQERFKYWRAEPDGRDYRRWDRPQKIFGGATMYPIENPPGVDGEREGIECCFVTTHFECKKAQVVDLWAEGVQPWILNDIKPAIVVSEWHAARSDCGSRYSLQASLYQGDVDDVDDDFDDDQAPVDVFRDSCVVRYGEGGVWKQSLHKFREYPANVRYVLFESSGRDAPAWAGFFGAKMAKASVTLEF